MDDAQRKMLAVKIRKEEIALAKDLESLSGYTKDNLCFFWKPFNWQDRLINGILDNNTTVVTSANKLGKTAAGANIVISWALGYEPWSEVDANYPGAVAARGKHYKPSSLGKAPPVKIIITGEDWKLHIGQTMITELKKWAPRGEYTTKKNEQGVEYIWDWKNGSQFIFMCYTQDDRLFESFMCDALWADEPIPQTKYDAISRGLFLSRGKKLLTLTPFNEPWILDELVLSSRKDIFILDGLVVTENENLHKADCDLLREAGLDESQIDSFFEVLLYENKEKELYVKDKGKASEAYLEHLGVSDEVVVGLLLLGFIRDCDPENVATRIFGKFKALVGKVLKQFDRDVHWVESFKVPTDWPVIAMIDFHLNTPQAISFHTKNEQGIHFVCKEIWENLSPEETADAIIRYQSQNALNLKKAYIDPLSKGDTQYMKNRFGDTLKDSFSIISERLAKHGIELQIASKDKDSGIRNLWTALTGVNSRPTLFIFNTCERHFYEVNRWVYDDDGKPAKKNDHFMENLYRSTLTGFKYTDKPAPVHYSPSTLRGSTAWMGG